MTKTNGGGNHEDGEDGGKPSNVSRFPTQEERREIERMKAAMKKAQEDARKTPSEPVLNLPPVVKTLCGILLAIHLSSYFLSDETRVAIVQFCGFIPARYTGGLPFSADALLAPVAHMFLHGGWLHLGINVGTLMAFGAALEKTVGGKKLLVLYFATGVLGAFVHALVYPDDMSPLIGASGGISGLFGGVLVMAQDRGMMGDGGGFRKLMPFILIWVIISIFFGAFGMIGESGQIAWVVHIAGFVAGLLLFRPVDRLKI